MPPDETPDTPQTEGQTIPPEEQIIPTAGLVQEDEQTQEAPSGGQPSQDEQGQGSGMAGQAQSLARENPAPLALAAAFVAGIVVGRIASR
jgi:hypothetical protein